MDNTNTTNEEIEKLLADKTEDEMLDLFVEQILIDKGFTDLAEDLKQEFRSEIKERLIVRINEAMVSALPDDKLEELEQMLDNNTATPESVNALVESSGVDMSGPIQEAMMDFRRVYLAGEVDEAENEGPFNSDEERVD